MGTRTEPTELYVGLEVELYVNDAFVKCEGVPGVPQVAGEMPGGHCVLPPGESQHWEKWSQGDITDNTIRSLRFSHSWSPSCSFKWARQHTSFFCLTYWGWISVTRSQRGPNAPLSRDACPSHPHLHYAGLLRPSPVSRIPTACAQVTFFPRCSQIMPRSVRFCTPGPSFPTLSPATPAHFSNSANPSPSTWELSKSFLCPLPLAPQLAWLSVSFWGDSTHLSSGSEIILLIIVYMIIPVSSTLPCAPLRRVCSSHTHLCIPSILQHSSFHTTDTH